MKQGKTIRGLAVLLSVAFLSSGVLSVTALAGKSDIVVGNSSFAEEISELDWSNPDGDVISENGVLVFPKESTEETRLITTALVQSNEELEELFHASVTMKFTSLPENEKFALAFGLQSIEAYQGEIGNVEITFQNNGGISIGVVAYDDAGDEVVVAEPVTCGSLNAKLSVDAVVTSGSKLTLKIAGKTICNETKLPVTGEGSIGFVQTGGCGVQVSDINIVAHKYDTPENTNIVETFDNGMNSNVFSSKTSWASKWYPHSLSVMEYEGDNVLMFERCATAYIGTRHEYSNFEMTFDMPFLQRVEERDEEGNVIEPKPFNFVVSFGGDSVDSATYGYTKAADAIVFSSSSTVSNLRAEHTGRDENHLIFDPKNDKGFSVKLSVIDAVVTVGLKWLGEHDYSTVLTYTIPNGTPTGYIHLWSVDIGNFAVDNITITNKDMNAKLIELEPKYDSFERVADFNYEEAELNFKKPETENEKDFQWYSIILLSGISAVVLLAGGFVTGEILKRRNKQEGGSDER